MIKRLQNKTIIVIMSIFIILVCFLSVFSYFSTKHALETSCETTLNTAFHYSSESQSFLSQSSTYPILVVSVDYQNNINILADRIHNLTTKEINQQVPLSPIFMEKSG